MSINVRTTHLFVAAVAVLGFALAESRHSIVRAAAGRPDAQDTQKKADGARSVWDGVYTDEQAKRGAPLYSEYCSSCHGPTMSGSEVFPALVGGEFMSHWDGLPLGDFFERIRASMPQNAPG